MKLASLLISLSLLAGCASAPGAEDRAAPHQAAADQAAADRAAPNREPQVPSEVPADAALLARFLVERLQQGPAGPERDPAVTFLPQALPDAPGFAYPGFRMTGHRLYGYAVLEGPTPGRDVNGVITLEDDLGRRAEIVYWAVFRVTPQKMVVEQCTMGPLYARDPRIDMFLVPRGRLPGPAGTWAATFEAVRAVDAMPPGGLTDAAQLDGHDLVLFVMDRTAPEGDVGLRLDLSNVRGLDPTMVIESRDYVDYDGWRVAVVSVVRGERT